MEKAEYDRKMVEEAKRTLNIRYANSFIAQDPY